MCHRTTSTQSYGIVALDIQPTKPAALRVAATLPLTATELKRIKCQDLPDINPETGSPQWSCYHLTSTV